MRCWAFSILLLFVVLSVLASQLAPYEVSYIDLSGEYMGFSKLHLLGQGVNGIDVLTHLLWGLRRSLSLGVLVMLFASALGLCVGVWASRVRGATEFFLLRLMDFVSAFPAFLLLLALSSVFSMGLFSLVVIMSLTSWSLVARMTRIISLEIFQESFMESAKAQGASFFRLILFHLFPSLLPQVLPYFVAILRRAIIAEAGLSFLGIGFTRDGASLGGLLAQGKDALWLAPHLVLLPTCVMFLLVSSLLVLGDGKLALSHRLQRR